MQALKYIRDSYWLRTHEVVTAPSKLIPTNHGKVLNVTLVRSFCPTGIERERERTERVAPLINHPERTYCLDKRFPPCRLVPKEDGLERESSGVNGDWEQFLSGAEIECGRPVMRDGTPIIPHCSSV